MLGSDGFSPEGCQKHGENALFAPIWRERERERERGEDKVKSFLAIEHGAITRSAAQPRLASRINIAIPPDKRFNDRAKP